MEAVVAVRHPRVVFRNCRKEEQKTFEGSVAHHDPFEHPVFFDIDVLRQ